MDPDTTATIARTPTSVNVPFDQRLGTPIVTAEPEPEAIPFRYSCEAERHFIEQANWGG